MALAELVQQEQPTPQRVIARWLGGLWPATADTYRRALELVPLVVNGSRDLASVPWQKLDHAALGRVREQLHQRGYRPATINRTLSAVRELMRALARPENGLVSREVAASTREVANLRASVTRTGRMLEQDEQQRLMTACNSVKHAPKFHRALVALLLAGGLRKAEAAAALMGDLTAYDADTGRLLVFGKGRKEREVYFTGTAKQALDEFKADDDRGWRFRKLETSQLGYVLLRLQRLAGVSHFATHDMRRTYASTQFDRGTDIATLQALMGHSSPVTTASYDRRGNERLKAAALDPWG